ncbi:MAG: alpha/beta fold hydrolase, partial [Balneolaceae bacterium]|nr:alpha/beta fold hydrolase [Balneolaceae bacterium]
MNRSDSSFFRGWRLWLLVYLLLLTGSQIWCAFNPDRHEPEPDQNTVTVSEVSGDSILAGQSLRIAYRDVYHGSDRDPPVILLLHGSPVGVPMLPRIINEMAAYSRVIAPDFPGYDASDHHIPDYSMTAFSVYMSQVLDSLDIASVHAVGYSLGGGVAINMAHREPGQIESITLLSSIGVQELELLGSYHLNRAVHGAQLALIWLLHEAVPHFGLLNDFPLNVPYARSFYDSDQRPIRQYLKNYKKPMLILHGEDDGLVPLAAAKEHHRIVPQSKLKLYDGGHGIVIRRANRLADDIGSYIRRVEAGEATTYAEAGADRIRQANQPFQNVNIARAEGITLFVLMILIIFSTFISEDLTCIGAGLLAARGIIGFWPATAACFIGIFIGDVGLYLIGRLLGRAALKRAPIKWFVTESDLEQSADWFKVKGPAIIIASRFVPGSRLPTYFSAGVIGAGFWMFTLYFLAAALIWTPLLVGISMLVGTELLRYFEVYQNYAVWVLLGTIFILFLFVKFVFPLSTWRGRRLIVSRWRRLTHWEFWPPYVLYFPVVLYIAYLWIRFGKLTTFTAANPSIPDGGFIGESKSAILEQFVPSGTIPPFITLSGKHNDWDKFVRARDFINNNDIGYPVVVKPDTGQRGSGVSIPKNEEQLKESLQGRSKDMIVQQYAEGTEFGVFYYRYPDEEEGTIFSITDKRLL